MEENKVHVLFSDLDGTIVHYPKEFNEYADIVEEDDVTQTAKIKYKHSGELRECVVLTSMTGGKSYLSVKTKQLIETLRDLGVCFVIITGARSSTYIARKAKLPPADYEFFENGGRMLKDGRLEPTWTDQFANQIGPVLDRTEILPDLPPPEQRQGSLWSLYNILLNDGWKIDSRHYVTNFRVDVNKSTGKTADDFKAVVARELSARNLASSFNLGKADIYPDSSGKANAARHILQIRNFKPEDSVAMFDDDNDLELGALVGRSFLPGVTHPSVLEALKTQPSWTLMQHRGFLGTESALETIIQLRRLALQRETTPLQTTS